MMNRLLLLGCLAAILALPAQGFDKAGRTAFQFTKIGVGARQTAIGEAAVSVVRDANGVFWNPALITGVTTAEASFSYASWFADLNVFSGSAGFRLENVGVLAFSYSGLGYGDIQEALVSSPTGSSDTRTGNSVTGKDMMFGFSIAREFTDNLSIGVTAKYLEEKLWTYSEHLWAFDVGTYYDTRWNGIRFAMSAMNFAGSVKFLPLSDEEEEGFDIPLLFRIGASIDLVNANDAFFSLGEANRVTLAVETVNSNDFGERWHVGAEYTFRDFLSLRGGYRFNYAEGNLSFGVGVQQKVAEFMLRLDYSYVSYEYLDSPHRLTLAFSF